MLFDSHISRRNVLRILAGGAALAAGGRTANANDARIARLIGKADALPTIFRRIGFISRALIGTPYRSHTLIGGPRKAEQLVVRDDAFDCVTYCESVLAAAMVRQPDEFEATLRRIRYRDGYVAWRERNHYFSEWSQCNVANRTCRQIALPGAKTIDKTLTLMPELGARRMSLSAIPRASLLAHKDLLLTGDIIGFLSQRPGLDYFHIGFVVVADNGELWLRHAAKSRHRVLDERLDRFLSHNHVHGVTLLRPQETHSDNVIV
jgi:hypothetical protein